MEWRHYETRQRGDCKINTVNGVEIASYALGIVETGRTRVFAGHFVAITPRNGDQIFGEDEHSLRKALWRLARNIFPLKMTISCVGLTGDWVESGLSMDTGWGYWGRHGQPCHIMSTPPDGAEIDEVDLLIREAVDSMAICYLGPPDAAIG